MARAKNTEVIEGQGPTVVELEVANVDVVINPDLEEEDDLSDLQEEESAELESRESAEDDEAAFLAALDQDLDPVEQARKESSIYLEKGLYFFKEIEAGHRFLSNDRRPNDKSPKGRFLWFINGTVVHSVTKRESRYQLTVSPDERLFGRESIRSGEPDGFSQSYAKFSAYFRKKHMKTAAKDAELWNFFKSGDYAFYLSQSASGNYLGRFQDKK